MTKKNFRAGSRPPTNNKTAVNRASRSLDEIAAKLLERMPWLNDPELVAEALAPYEAEQAIMRAGHIEGACRCSGCLCETTVSVPTRGPIVPASKLKMPPKKRLAEIKRNANGRDLTERERSVWNKLWPKLTDEQRTKLNSSRTET